MLQSWNPHDHRRVAKYLEKAHKSVLFHWTASWKIIVKKSNFIRSVARAFAYIIFTIGTVIVLSVTRKDVAWVLIGNNKQNIYRHPSQLPSNFFFLNALAIFSNFLLLRQRKTSWVAMQKMAQAYSNKNLVDYVTT